MSSALLFVTINEQARSNHVAVIVRCRQSLLIRLMSLSGMVESLRPFDRAQDKLRPASSLCLMNLLSTAEETWIPVFRGMTDGTATSSRQIQDPSVWSRGSFSCLSVLTISLMCAGCGSSERPLAIRMYNPKSNQTLHCTARGQQGQDSTWLANAVESCARQLEANGFVREK